MLERVWRKGSLSYTVGGNVNGIDTTEKSMEVP